MGSVEANGERVLSKSSISLWVDRRCQREGRQQDSGEVISNLVVTCPQMGRCTAYRHNSCYSAQSSSLNAFDCILQLSKSIVAAVRATQHQDLQVSACFILSLLCHSV
jgi:hypothetical protein